MSLSHEERARLDEIEAELRATDPNLSDRLGLPQERPSTLRRRRRLIGCTLLVLVGNLVMVLGAAGVRGIDSYGTVFVLVGIATMGWALVRARQINPPPRAPGR